MTVNDEGSYKSYSSLHPNQLKELRDLLTFAESPSALDKEIEDLLVFAAQSEPAPPKPTAAQRGQAWEAEWEAKEAEAEEAKMEAARRELEGSWLPGMRAYGVAAGAPIVSTAARLIGRDEYADEAIRAAARTEQAQREREAGGIVPDILQRGARGGLASYTQMAGAGMVAGPYGAISAAAIQQGNQSITEGRDAGKKGRELAEYAITKGIWEGMPAMVMQAIGMGGFEKIFDKKAASNAVSVGLRQGLKRLGVTAAEEFFEENLTEVVHLGIDDALKADPDAFTLDNIKQTVADTTVQTGIMVAFGGAPNVVRSVQAGKMAQLSEEIQSYAREGKIPSRKTWREWGLTPEMGGSRAQRRAFIGELAKQLEAEAPTEGEFGVTEQSIAPEGSEGAVLAPTAVQEGVVAPEGLEIPPEQAAVTEAPGATDWAATTEVPEAPGEVPAPEGYIRVYHYTGMEGIEEAGDEGAHLAGERIRNEGISIEHAKGEKYGEPNVVWVSTTKPDPGKVYAEIFIAKNDPRWGSFWRDSGPGEGQDAFLTGSIAPNEIIGVHEPWHSQYRHLKEDPKLLQQAQSGEFDHLLDTSGYGPAVRKVKAEAPGAVKMPAEMQKLAEDAGAPSIDPTNPPVEDNTTALNKAGGAKIREFVNLPALSEEAVQTWDAVMERVAVNKADEAALDTATEVIRTRRQITSYEYGAMALKAHKLLGDLEVAQSNQAEAAEAGKKFSYQKASVQIETITGQLDLLTEAARYSRREIARALSIGQMRLSRESFDTADIIKRMQGARGPGKKLLKKQLAEAARRGKRYADLVKQVAELEEQSRIKDEQLEAALAGKVLEVNKIRGRRGRGIKERARIEREDIKKRIRQMGLRVNDITGVSVEGTYLIGRLGITYIKEGVGTLVEVAERLRADLPDLNLTQSDVNQALIARSPKEVARAKKENNRRVTQLVSMARMHVELEGLANGVDLAVKKKKATVPAEVKALKKKLTEARLRFYASDIEAAKKERAIETVNRLQDQLDNGLTRLKESPQEIPPELANLREQARQLRMEIGVDAKLAEVQEIKKQIKEGTYIPPPEKVKKPVNEKLQRKRIELARERREIRQMIADAAPWTIGKVVKETAFTLKAIKATADISFTMRQNLWQVFSHPVLAKRAFVPALKAFFSQNSADRINDAIRDQDNAFLYEQAGLAILDGESQDQAQRSEVFRARVIEKIPGIGHVIRASGRHAAAFSNLMRTSAFDQFIDNHPEATQDQMVAFADYLNVSTGLGNLGKAGAIGDTLQVVFFSPKFAVSRIQTPWALVKYRNVPGVRKQIAKDMVGVVSTGGIVLALAKLAGFDVELWDFDDPDWGKIRFGNIRIDIWGGFQQPARVIARLATGAFYKDFDPLEISGRFAAFKLAPITTMPIELARGKTAVGEETTRLETIARSFVPLVFEDMRDAWREEGTAAGLGIGALAIAGVGVSAYKDSETATRKEIEKLQGKGEFSKAEKLFWTWNNENSDNQISREWFLNTKK